MISVMSAVGLSWSLDLPPLLVLRIGIVMIKSPYGGSHFSDESCDRCLLYLSWTAAWGRECHWHCQFCTAARLHGPVPQGQHLHWAALLWGKCAFTIKAWNIFHYYLSHQYLILGNFIIEENYLIQFRLSSWKCALQVSLEEEFLQLSSCQLLNLIQRDELNVPDEKDVYNAVLKWVMHDEDSRQPKMEHILQAVRWAGDMGVLLQDKSTQSRRFIVEVIWWLVLQLIAPLCLFVTNISVDMPLELWTIIAHCHNYLVLLRL